MSYRIFVLHEDAITVDGAGQGAIPKSAARSGQSAASSQRTQGAETLDGRSQGDGSHLVGATITLRAGAWQGIAIDDNDPTFADNDGSQRLAEDTDFGGETFSAGTRVEAEYSLTVTDGTDTWTAVAFNLHNSSPQYAMVEGLAFVGGPGGFPPVGVPLTVTAAQEGPEHAADTFAAPMCFVAGTRIAVPGGEVPVETLRPGDMVLTREAGAQPLRWIGQRTVAAEGRFAPVEFAPGTVGNRSALRLSRQHRLRHSGWRAELYFGEDSVLIPAAHFVDGTRVRIVEGGLVTYVHLMFDRHRIVFAEGAEAESFHATARSLALVPPAARAELLALFPGIAEGRATGPLAHPALGRREARALLAG
ncbi:Hint domain-containing protein [Roseibacterium sp. SDUM158017]|uniref:Hint domain-containing protein n=1 Tax=Roseicyclus salinarum TaxID=3036773 RepID=UPI002414F8CB|nr:Hint domain-containing protein [Roseibacterium sp. SDUM158017]MDG4649343.1 Hint domain-containing protein [Roseibacterium sp. SDUM158017]